jgi:hypothetical protein
MVFFAYSDKLSSCSSRQTPIFCIPTNFILQFQANTDHNCITVVEQILSWTDMELLALLKKKKAVKKTKKLLGQTEMTLLSDPTGDGTTFSSQTASGTVLGTTTLNLTANETLSDTLIGQKRSAGDGQTGVLKVFAVDLIQVSG